MAPSDGDDTPEVRIAIRVLKEILVGSPASPLRKALLDSGLGEDLIGGAEWDEMRQPAFVTGLKGVTRGKSRSCRAAGPRYAEEPGPVGH